MFKTDDDGIAILMCGVIFVILCFFTYPAAKRCYRAHLQEGKEVKTVTIINPKNHRSKVYQVTEFVDNKPGYCSFYTADGRFVEIVDTEIKEK